MTPVPPAATDDGATTQSHDYRTRLEWTGNLGLGTADYAGYGRGWRALVEGKPPLDGSADAAFRGDATRHNPEDLFVAALSSCHMLSYLALCAHAGIRVESYVDDAVGTMVIDRRGGGRFESVTLHPTVVVADAAQIDRARALHETAHARCFIAASCRMPVHCEPHIVAAEG